MTIKQLGGVFGRNPTFNDVTVAGDLTTYGVNNLEGGYAFQRNYATWPYTVFSRAQGTRASPTTIGNGQTLSEIYFDGYTNGQYRSGARIQAKVSAGVIGDEIPTTLTFSTTADGANSPTDRWAIDHTGNLVALQSGNGIDFSATGTGTGTSTSELLDDYEAGTWTPTVTSTSGTITSVTSQIGTYTKIGRLVTIQYQFNIVTLGTASGAIVVSNMPFTEDNSAISYYAGVHRARAGASSITEFDPDGNLYLYGTTPVTNVYFGSMVYNTTA
jgi:hypothetical protein